jgi:hypothetical protein
MLRKEGARLLTGQPDTVGFLPLLARMVSTKPPDMSMRERLRRGCMLTAARVMRVAMVAAAPLLRPLFRSHQAANARARENAESIIRACRAFQAKHGRLPDSLEALVPEFLPSLPPARYDGPHFGFQYTVDSHIAATRAGLDDTIPFGRPFYVFEEDHWGYLD